MVVNNRSSDAIILMHRSSLPWVKTNNLTPWVKTDNLTPWVKVDSLVQKSYVLFILISGNVLHCQFCRNNVSQHIFGEASDVWSRKVRFSSFQCKKNVLLILMKENIPGAKCSRCQNVCGVKLSVFTHGVKLSAVSNCPGVKLSGVKLSAVSNCPAVTQNLS